MGEHEKLDGLRRDGAAYAILTGLIENGMRVALGMDEDADFERF